MLGARPGRPSFGCGCWAGERLAEGVVPRGLDDEGIWGRPCCVVLVLACCWCCEAMDDEEFLGRAVASGEGARVWFMALGPQWASEGHSVCAGCGGGEERWKPSLGGRGYMLLHPGRASPCRSQRWWKKGIAQVEPAGVKPWRRPPARLLSNRRSARCC